LVQRRRKTTFLIFLFLFTLGLATLALGRHERAKRRASSAQRCPPRQHTIKRNTFSRIHKCNWNKFPEHVAHVRRNIVEESDGGCTSSARKIAVRTKQGAVLHMGILPRPWKRKSCSPHPTTQDILTRKKRRCEWSASNNWRLL
jgi:hypothetical protein